MWAAPPDDVRDRLKKLMDGLRLIFGSPEFQTEQDALNKFKSPSEAYMPHLSLLYGDLTEEEKSAAQEKAVQLHDNINNLSFLIGRLELWKTDIGYTVLCT
ncbi:Cyclic phosphodiesterase [Linum perenne]